MGMLETTSQIAGVGVGRMNVGVGVRAGESVDVETGGTAA